MYGEGDPEGRFCRSPGYRMEEEYQGGPSPLYKEGQGQHEDDVGMVGRGWARLWALEALFILGWVILVYDTLFMLVLCRYLACLLLLLKLRKHTNKHPTDGE